MGHLWAQAVPNSKAEPLAETPVDDLAGGAALCQSGIFLPGPLFVTFISRIGWTNTLQPTSISLSLHTPAGELDSALPDALLGGHASHHAQTLADSNVVAAAEILTPEGQLKPGTLSTLNSDFQFLILILWPDHFLQIRSTFLCFSRGCHIIRYTAKTYQPHDNGEFLWALQNVGWISWGARGGSSKESHLFSHLWKCVEVCLENAWSQSACQVHLTWLIFLFESNHWYPHLITIFIICDHCGLGGTQSKTNDW